MAEHNYEGVKWNEIRLRAECSERGISFLGQITCEQLRNLLIADDEFKHAVGLTEIKTPIQAGKLSAVLEAKNQELHRRLEQICAGTLHAQLAKVGIVYNIPTAEWRFLDVGQEKDLAALLYKLFSYDRTTGMILSSYEDEEEFQKFREWLHAHAIHLEDNQLRVEVEQPEPEFNPIPEQKEPPPPGAHKPPDLQEEGTADFPGL